MWARNAFKTSRKESDITWNTAPQSAFHRRRFYFDDKQTGLVGHFVRLRSPALSSAGSNDRSKAIPNCMSGIFLFLAL